MIFGRAALSLSSIIGCVAYLVMIARFRSNTLYVTVVHWPLFQNLHYDKLRENNVILC